MGLARTFQNIALFRGMTVLDNVKLGAHTGLTSGLLDACVYLGKARREEAALREQIEREARLKDASRALEHSATHDPLTGLANRAAVVGHAGPKRPKQSSLICNAKIYFAAPVHGGGEILFTPQRTRGLRRSDRRSRA